MLRIKLDGLTDEEVISFSNFMEAMKDMPEKVIYDFFVSMPAYKKCLVFVDESFFDAIDLAVVPYLEVLEKQYVRYKSSVKAYEKACVFSVYVDGKQVSIEPDAKNRPVAYAKIDLWKNEAWTLARDKMEHERLEMWRLWGDAIPELVPVIEEDRLDRGGTKAFTRKLPGWKHSKGRILSLRE